MTAQELREPRGSGGGRPDGRGGAEAGRGQDGGDDGGGGLGGGAGCRGPDAGAVQVQAGACVQVGSMATVAASGPAGARWSGRVSRPGG